MKKIAIFQSDLRVGGVQKALLNILNEIDYSEYSVDLFLFDREHFFDLPEKPNLKIIYLKPFFRMNRMVYFNILKKMFKIENLPDCEYDIAIDFNSYQNDCSIGALSVKAKKRVMWIHNDVEIKLKNEKKYRILWHFFNKKLHYFDEFCAVSPGIIEGFRKISGIYDKKITSIPNHVDANEIFRKSEIPLENFEVDESKYNLCSVGRICHQKGFDILMEHLKNIKSKRDNLHFYLIGDGPDREKLEEQIANLGLKNDVTLLGNQPNPFNYMNKMDGFVLTSRYEGQGIVTIEAKALGLALFIPPHLEKYNPSVPSVADIEGAIINAEKKDKIRDDLSEYNSAIGKSLTEVLTI